MGRMADKELKMTDFILIIIQAVIPGIIVGIIMAYWNRKQNKKYAAIDGQKESEKKKDALVISLLVATAELSYATTMAIKRGSPNGEVEAAVKKYSQAMEKFREFEREQLFTID